MTPSVSEQIEVKRNHTRKIRGMRKFFKSSFTVAVFMATCEQGRCPARAEHHESVFLASFFGFPGVAASICLHYMHSLSCNLAQDNQSPLDYPKD